MKKYLIKFTDNQQESSVSKAQKDYSKIRFDSWKQLGIIFIFITVIMVGVGILFDLFEDLYYCFFFVNAVIMTVYTSFLYFKEISFVESNNLTYQPKYIVFYSSLNLGASLFIAQALYFFVFFNGYVSNLFILLVFLTGLVGLVVYEVLRYHLLNRPSNRMYFFIVYLVFSLYLMNYIVPLNSFYHIYMISLVLLLLIHLLLRYLYIKESVGILFSLIMLSVMGIAFVEISSFNLESLKLQDILIVSSSDIKGEPIDILKGKFSYVSDFNHSFIETDDYYVLVEYETDQMKLTIMNHDFKIIRVVNQFVDSYVKFYVQEDILYYEVSDNELAELLGYNINRNSYKKVVRMNDDFTFSDLGIYRAFDFSRLIGVDSGVTTFNNLALASNVENAIVKQAWDNENSSEWIENYEENEIIFQDEELIIFKQDGKIIGAGNTKIYNHIEGVLFYSNGYIFFNHKNIIKVYTVEGYLNMEDPIFEYDQLKPSNFDLIYSFKYIHEKFYIERSSSNYSRDTDRVTFVLSKNGEFQDFILYDFFVVSESNIFSLNDEGDVILVDEESLDDYILNHSDWTTFSVSLAVLFLSTMMISLPLFVGKKFE